MDSKWTPNVLLMDSRSTPIRLQIGSEEPPKGPQMYFKCTPNVLQMDSKESPNGLQMDFKWTPNGPSPNRTQRHSNLTPIFLQIDSRNNQTLEGILRKADSLSAQQVVHPVEFLLLRAPQCGALHAQRARGCTAFHRLHFFLLEDLLPDLEHVVGHVLPPHDLGGDVRLRNGRNPAESGQTRLS